MKRNLQILFTGILIVMLGVTVWASVESNVMKGLAYLFQDRWAVATLTDAYCGFLTFYAWVFYKERGWRGRIGWFVAILLLGNIGMAFYMLRLLWKLGPEASPEQILLRTPQ